MPTRPRREKRIHRQHCSSCCRWILFFCGSAKRAPGVWEKRGGSAPVAERVVRRTGGKGPKVGWRGMKKCGDALRSARRIEKARGESKKRTGESKNKGRAIEKQGIAESKRRGRNLKECGVRNPKARGRGIRRRAICPPPCRDEEFG